MIDGLSEMDARAGILPLKLVELVTWVLISKFILPNMGTS